MHIKHSPKLYFDPIVTSDSTNCVIPFSRAGNLILIKAKADTTEGNFIPDTGAPGLVLNLTYFRNYATNNEGDPGGITGTVATLQTTVSKFFIGPVTWYKAESDLVNLGHIETAKDLFINSKDF